MALALDLGTLNARLKREKAQSGAITASLIWNDPSDLDLHAHVKPNGGGAAQHIFFGNKKAAGGYLDVDMNAQDKGKGFSLEPVENIFWTTPPGGSYEIKVNNFQYRPTPGQKEGPVPFKVFLNKDGTMKTYSGKVKRGQTVTAFKFNVAGSGSSTGGGGSYIVFPPEAGSSTFKDLCSKHGVPWKQGSGYYAVARSEKIHSYKEMLLQDVKKDKFTVGSAQCRKALGWPSEGELKKGPKDIGDGLRLFVQSTSANRVIPPGTHVLFEVTPELHAKLRKAINTKFEDETHTIGKKGMSAAGKAAAKAKAKAAGKAAAKAAAKAKAGAKAKAKAAAKREAAPKAGAKRAASSGGGGLSGKTIVFTGTLSTPRAAATAAAKDAGATVKSDVSSTTNILVAGVDAGSKMARAEKLGVEVWDEAKFKRAVGL